MTKQRIVLLTPPTISQDHIAEKISCIRAHRERIFQVSVQPYEDKLIYHNYGHGGAGWTFLFGCVARALRMHEQTLRDNPPLRHKPITVLGAGCYGLLTAIHLARAGHNVRIVAKEFQDLPSYKAAGFFFPRPRKSSTAEETAQFLATGIESYTQYNHIIKGTHPFLSDGPALLPCYYARDIDPGFTPYIAHGLLKPPTNVTVTFTGKQQYAMTVYESLFIHAPRMMAELKRTITELKIPLTQAHITDFQEIPESIIFNCTGLGAKPLTQDARIIPVQGHLIMLKNQPPPEQMHYMINTTIPAMSPRGFMRDELIYYAPKDAGVLGITFLRGVDSPTANAHEFDRLITRCQDFFEKI